MEEIAWGAGSLSSRLSAIAPHTTAITDPSFAALPGLVVIDGGKGQLSDELRAIEGFAGAGSSSSRSPSRSRRCSFPAVPESLKLPHNTPELQLLGARDEAHRFAITHHRQRRDRAMTASILDQATRGQGEAKRALLTHFR